MTVSPPLIPEQRHQEILRLLRSAGVLSIRHLGERLNVSHMTIRRDIATLEESGRVIPVQGGVRLSGALGSEPPRERGSRVSLELPRKQAIGRRAAEFVEDDMVVFLDAGTTCEAIVPFLLDRRGVTVVTNDFFTVLALLPHPEITTIHTGGVVDSSSGSASGPLAAATVAGLGLDLSFVSTGAWDLTHGVTTPETDKVLLKHAAREAAASCILVADSTKFGLFERFKALPLDALDGIVSDCGLPEESRSSALEYGLELAVAEL